MAEHHISVQPHRWEYSARTAENFVLRHIALNLLKRETSTRRSLEGKRKKAAWDEAYLLKVLTG